jgi:folylpolyglutamate synthase/dihydropteroate synthase
LLGDGAEMVSSVILTEANTHRAWEAQELMELARAVSPDRPMRVVKPVAQALEKALELSPPEAVTLVCGSLYVVAGARAAWNGRAGPPGGA